MKQSIIILLSFIILGAFNASAIENSIESLDLNIGAQKKIATNFPSKKPNKPFLLSPVQKPKAPISSETLTNKEFDILDLAIQQSKKWKWDKVTNIKKNLKDESALDLVDWIRYYNGASDLTFTNYINYIIKKDNWTEIENIKLKAESKIRFSDSC